MREISTEEDTWLKSICKKAAALLLAAALCAALLSGCAAWTPEADDGRLRIVTTIFPPCDFAANIVAQLAVVDQLLPPGAESHSYEPTPRDILAIQDCDLFIYTGGENDVWVEDILGSMGEDAPETLTLMACVDLLDEEAPEGAADRGHAHEPGEHEVDEHVWTSPKNAVKIVSALCERLCALDPDNASPYRANTEIYLDKLYELDAQLVDIVANAARTEIVVGDRFPFRYLAEDYGLTAYAAFPACGHETEPSAATIAFLCDKIEEDGLPVVFYIEFSNHLVADAVAETTGARTLLLHSCHNISRAERDAGADYISLMRQNAENLKEALS